MRELGTQLMTGETLFYWVLKWNFEGLGFLSLPLWLNVISRVGFGLKDFGISFCELLFSFLLQSI